jgi:hypothetical protein
LLTSPLHYLFTQGKSDGGRHDVKRIKEEWQRDPGRLVKDLAAPQAAARGAFPPPSSSSRRRIHQLLPAASEHARASDISTPEFKPVREFLEGVSRSRVAQGFSSDETASFIFSLKKPLFAALRADAGKDADALADQVWRATELLDALGLHTIKTYQKSAKTSSTASSARCSSCPRRS